MVSQAQLLNGLMSHYEYCNDITFGSGAQLLTLLCHNLQLQRIFWVPSRQVPFRDFPLSFTRVGPSVVGSPE